MTYISPPVMPGQAWQRPLRRLASRIASLLQRHATERAIESMPFDMRKDIGWPSSVSVNTTRKTA